MESFEESELPLHQRVVCSTISFRRHPLEAALSLISELGFRTIDLGALPGVCDHVPYELTADAVIEVAGTLRRSGLAVRSINADVGDLNRELDDVERDARDAHLERLFDLAQQVGAPAMSPGNGEVDFAAALEALSAVGFTGDFSLELETPDVTEADRPAAALRASEFISSLL